MADILISQLPKTEAAGDSDLLIIDSFDAATGGIVTNAIKWADLYAKIETFPQGIKFPDGNALQPSITFLNDTNTGIYRHATDTIGFSTNGLVRLVINQDGNLGIGTVNPEEKLHVEDGNITVRYGGNQLDLRPEDGGMSVRQAGLLPLTFATNDLTRMTISPDGRVLVGTIDLDSDSMLRVAGTVQAGVATLSTNSNLAAIGVKGNATVNVMHFSADGSIADKDLNYGTAGQVITSDGPGKPWKWGVGGGGGQGGLVFRGELDITQPAPLNPLEGDFYLNNTNGNAHPTFGTTEYTTVNAFVVYGENGWVIQSQNLEAYVDLTSDQTINGEKTFTEDIIGTVLNCKRSVIAGAGLSGGGELSSDVTLTVNVGNGLGLTTNEIIVRNSDNTIAVDAGGIRVDKTALFSDDPAIAAGVTSFKGRRGAVVPTDDDYELDMMSDVTTGTASEGQVLTRVGTQWVPRDIEVEGGLAFQGEINATIVTAPAQAQPGQFWVQTGNDGNILTDASWGTLSGQAVIEGDMIVKSQDIPQQIPQWAIIGNLGGPASAVQSIAAQNGVTNAGTNANVVLEADNTVVRTTGDQTIAGTKTFDNDIIGNLDGDCTGTSGGVTNSVNAGAGLSGGGILTSSVTLNVNTDSSLGIISDALTVLTGDGLKNGSDGNGGPAAIDLDWLNNNYTPDVSSEVGDGQISLVAVPNGGIGLTGQNATANQQNNTGWSIAVDSSVVRTSDSYFKEANLAVLPVLN